MKRLPLLFILFTLIISSGITGGDSSIAAIYQKLEGDAKPEPELFEKAFVGYIDLKLNGNFRSDKNILTIIDFRRSSKEKRLWVVDLDRKKVVYNLHVAHGENSGKEYALYFSNEISSHKSSLGFYETGKTYIGKNGLSLKLKGLEKEFNSNAFERYIVLHGADYAEAEYLEEYGILGNSKGCPAVSQKNHKELIEYTKEGTCLLIYFPDINYLEGSKYLDN